MYKFDSPLFIFKFVFLFQLLATAFAVANFCNKKEKFALRTSIVVCVDILLTCTIPLVSTSPLYVCAMFLSIFGVTACSLFFIYNEKKSVILFISIFSYTIQHICYILSNLLTNLTGISISNAYSTETFTTNDLFSIVVNLGIYAALFIFVLSYAVRLKSHNTKVTINNRILFIISLVTLLSNVILNAFISKEFETLSIALARKYDYKNMLLIYSLYDIVTAIFVIISLTWSIKVQSEVEENKALIKIYEKEKEVYKVKKANLEELKILCHDLKSRINKLDIKDSGTIKKAQATLKKYENIYETGNNVLDIILFDLSQKCDKHNILLTCNIDGKLLNFINEVDLYSLFDNVVQNAYEASKKITRGSGRYIKITINKKKDAILIDCENKYDGKDINIQNGIPQSTKSDSAMHGLGTRSIIKTVSAYNGFVKFTTENSIFHTIIIFTNN